jgi:release factor glutamine methyltransferase
MVDEITTLLKTAGIEHAEADAQRIIQRAGADAAAARALASERASGKPLGYVLGIEQFMDLELEVAPGALIPRPETELLGRMAVRLLRERGPEPAFIDMCCGSGNLACGIASALPSARAWASDLTDGTVSLARRNVERLGLTRRITVGQGDLFAPLAGIDPVDAVVCNPPYISTGRLGKERAELLAYEPREAFDGGPYGLTIHQRVVREALPFLKSDGWLLFEIGQGQERQLTLLFQRVPQWSPMQLAADAAGNPRVAFAQRRS